MPILTPIAVDRGTSLDDLNEILSQNESFIGPLTSMTIEGDQSIFMLENTPTSPDKPAVLRRLSDPSSGGEAICFGTIFIGDNPTPAVAER
ncbi:MAG: hypothetical protein J7494_07895 [Sphingobium sp.]|nr:hypothetical protein [Sphingobium sp.]